MSADGGELLAEYRRLKDRPAWWMDHNGEWHELPAPEPQQPGERQ